MILDLLFCDILYFKTSESSGTLILHYFSLINSRHSNDDFYDMQTMCKPKEDPGKPNSAMCKFHFICKPQNLGDSDEICKILSWHSLFSWAYYVPHIPGSICWSHFFRVKNSLHGLHRFTPDCPPMSRFGAPAMVWEEFPPVITLSYFYHNTMCYLISAPPPAPPLHRGADACTLFQECA